jgi:hypothetical protein
MVKDFRGPNSFPLTLGESTEHSVECEGEILVNATRLVKQFLESFFAAFGGKPWEAPLIFNPTRLRITPSA